MSPPFHVLKKVGGPMSIEEFRQDNENKSIQVMKGLFKPSSLALKIQSGGGKLGGIRVGQVLIFQRQKSSQ